MPPNFGARYSTLMYLHLPQRTLPSRCTCRPDGWFGPLASVGAARWVDDLSRQHKALRRREPKPP